jgi:hypothetical protein
MAKKATKGKARGPSDAQLTAFLKKLETWNGDPTFQDVLLDAAAHAAAINERNGTKLALVADLAKQTNIEASLIRKWISGKAPINRKLATTMVNEIRIYLATQRVSPADRTN